MTPEEWKAQLDKAHNALETPAYKEYHNRVVAEGVKQTSEEMRTVWEAMSYELEYVEGYTVEDVVGSNIDAMENDA